MIQTRFGTNPTVLRESWETTRQKLTSTWLMLGSMDTVFERKESETMTIKKPQPEWTQEVAIGFKYLSSYAD